jgi:hypothetical protein
MVELTESARHCLGQFLADLRSSLRPCPSVNVADVERDVLEHIDLALAGVTGAVDAAQLQDVLLKLGRPSQWVPQEDLNPIQRVLLGLKSGPEDLRLGYLTFVVFVGTLLLATCLYVALGLDSALPFLLLGITVSFLLARASLAAGAGTSPVERWLIYPPLVAFYVPISIVLVLWPLAAAILTEVLLFHTDMPEHILKWARSCPTGTITALAFLTTAAFWWGILSFVAWRWPAVVRDVYAPFVPSFRRRGLLLVLSALCALVFLGCARIWLVDVPSRVREMQHLPSSPLPRDMGSQSPH